MTLRDLPDNATPAAGPIPTEHPIVGIFIQCPVCFKGSLRTVSAVTQKITQFECPCGFAWADGE